jgi:hypothetical protein
MPRDAIDRWSEAMPDVSDRRALNAWLNAMPQIEDPVPQRKSAPTTDDGLVYKTLEQLPPTPAPNEEPALFRFMDDHEQAAWDQWLGNRIDTVVDAVGAEVGALNKQLNDDLRAEIAELKTEIAEIRADIEELRAVIREDANTRNIAPLIPLKGGRDAA